MAGAAPPRAEAQGPVFIVPVPHRPVVVHRPAPQPIIVHRPAPQPVVVHVTDPAPPEDVDVLEPPPRDPYDTAGIVVAGGGAGGLMFMTSDRTEVSLGYNVHLGLAVDAAEFGLRLALAPDAVSLARDDGTLTDTSFAAAGASFSYRFLPGADVHPVFGVGLEGMFLTPDDAATTTAFALTGRLGLELAYPLSDGALALGIDLTGHHPFASTSDGFALDEAVSFGAYADYRF
jgi:hypothetical protein